MVGKEVVTAANVSAGTETLKAAPILAAFTVGGLTPFEWAYTLAAVYSGLLILHLVIGKWVIPLVRFVRARRQGKGGAVEVVE